MIETRFFTNNSYVTDEVISDYFKKMYVWRDQKIFRSKGETVIHSNEEFQNVLNVYNKFKGDRRLPNLHVCNIDIKGFDIKNDILHFGLQNPEYLSNETKDLLKDKDFKLYFSFLLYKMSISFHMHQGVLINQNKKDVHTMIIKSPFDNPTYGYHKVSLLNMNNLNSFIFLHRNSDGLEHQMLEYYEKKK